ncbi:hypothetical protein ACGFQG_20525 [Nocardia fluminea]|uniref:hypothetical protein n=1 Tax=Nocardia fluminea TaxID=134984 RepID=UPI00371D7FD5
MTTPTPSGPHLSSDQLTGRADSVADAHLRACAECRTRAEGWQNLAVAAQQASADIVGAFRTPSFDALLGDAVGMPWAAAAESPRPDLRAALVLAAGVARAQLRLLPRAMVPLSVLGFVGSVLLAILTQESGSAPKTFGLAITLLFQLGTISVCIPNLDPRLELFGALPIPPSAVFASRLVVVLIADSVLALLASALASELGATADFSGMVAGWLGPALFASAVGVVCAVWRSAQLGAIAGAIVWALGAAAATDSGPAQRLGALIEPLWSTSALTLLLAAVLFAAAGAGMSRYRYGVVG